MQQPCQCPESLSHFCELCESCKHEYAQWEMANAVEAREEGLRLPAAQLIAALEMFDAQMTAAVISIRKAAA